jgi:hypothetical protein
MPLGGLAVESFTYSGVDVDAGKMGEAVRFFRS